MALLRLDEEDLPQQVSLNFLDFSKLKIRTKEDLNSALWKLPELRLRQEQLSEKDILGLHQIRSSPIAALEHYHFIDPIPLTMQNIKIRDLSQVDIDWKMLTLSRPQSKIDEDAFSRFIELDKLSVKTMLADGNVISKRNVGTAGSFRSIKPSRSLLNVKSCSSGNRNKHNADESEEEKEHETLQEFSYSFYEREAREEESRGSSDIPDLLALTENLFIPAKQRGKRKDKDHAESSRPNEKRESIISRQKGKKKTKKKCSSSKLNSGKSPSLLDTKTRSNSVLDRPRSVTPTPFGDNKHQQLSTIKKKQETKKNEHIQKKATMPNN
ncbi:uncharacterized protein LOC111087294 [Limulus polyphemus]|uniref:Uncharacterized protein LOC111087294 n=1 Tax=Limulus polyphemus TaxID=6850 RepID=A0ABM1SZW5_LIMPO|nr:uncharacterized protein LOC111087294 [Limulus polyphemus]XP_022249172.1 uncharacterized protein LOC111087294 [Limulus polyphemus]XP_022249173.1 uncharacterized protein LOC111087294 [Limulus polyphemus]